jgi:hypothetical protein
MSRWKECKSLAEIAQNRREKQRESRRRDPLSSPSAKQVRKNLSKKREFFLICDGSPINKGFGPVDRLWDGSLISGSLRLSPLPHSQVSSLRSFAASRLCVRFWLRLCRTVSSATSVSSGLDFDFVFTVPLCLRGENVLVGALPRQVHRRLILLSHLPSFTI